MKKNYRLELMSLMVIIHLLNFCLKDRLLLFENGLLSAALCKTKKKSEKVIKLKTLLRNYAAEFYISKLSQIDDAFGSEFNRNLISKIRNNNDAQIYLFASR